MPPLPPHALRSDLPTLGDQLEWQDEVGRIGERIQTCSTPHVMGIHGDWGSGKTSFMRQVQRGLGAEMPLDSSVDRDARPLPKTEKQALQKRVVTVWFDAWQYQNEPVPIVALLHEMRRQMALIPSVATKLKKISAIAAYSVLDALSDAAKVLRIEGLPSVEKIEKRGSQWENEHYANPLTSNSIREHLRETIKALLPSDEARIVIFIDDLDRCNPKTAIRLLEALKIYMSIPQCVFVLGMNERILVDAIRDEISVALTNSGGDDLKLRAGHYLEKICTDIYRLPLPPSAIGLLSQWLDDTGQKQALQLAVGNLSCLPPNPRRLKALANQWSRFAACVTFPSDAGAQKVWAVRVLVAAYIHQFHRDIWERWHFNSDFWEEIQALCNGERETTKPEWAQPLRMTYSTPEYDEDNQPTFKSMYSNPGDIDNFWIGALIFVYKDRLDALDFKPLLTVPGVSI